jgi:hypothetical protein
LGLKNRFEVVFDSLRLCHLLTLGFLIV